MQNPDGSWHAYYVGNDVKDPTLDTNVACYLATGVWHHYLCTGDTVVPARASGRRSSAPSTTRSAYQTETGEIAWRADDPADGALLTGSSSIHHSLRCAIAIAERLGHDRPDWELSVGALAIAIAHRPERFLDKGRWAMDWYYPILGGVLRGQAAQMRIAAYWDTFVVAGARRALRVRPAVGDRGGDVRARHGTRRDRRDRARPTSSSAGSSSSATTTARTGAA